MNKTLNLENTNSEIKFKTREDILDERVTKLEKAVFQEPMEAEGPSDEETRIVIIGDADRKLYAKVCTLCLSEDGVNVIYKEGDKEKARACFQNEMKPVDIREYLKSTYDLTIRSANCLTRAYQSLYGTTEAPKAKLEKWLHELLENDGEKLVRVRNLGKKSFKEVMAKVGGKK